MEDGSRSPLWIPTSKSYSKRWWPRNLNTSQMMSNKSSLVFICLHQTISWLYFCQRRLPRRFFPDVFERCHQSTSLKGWLPLTLKFWKSYFLVPCCIKVGIDKFLVKQTNFISNFDIPILHMFCKDCPRMTRTCLHYFQRAHGTGESNSKRLQQINIHRLFYIFQFLAPKADQKHLWISFGFF